METLFLLGPIRLACVQSRSFCANGAMENTFFEIINRTRKNDQNEKIYYATNYIFLKPILVKQ